MPTSDVLQAEPDAAAPDGKAGRPRILPPYLLVLRRGTAEPGPSTAAGPETPVGPGPAQAARSAPPTAGPPPGPAALTQAKFHPHKIRKSDLDEINRGSFVKSTLAAAAVGVATWAAGVLAQEPVSMLVGTCLTGIAILSYTSHRIRVREEIAERKGVWQGTCPHCSGSVVLAKSDTLVSCTHCGNPVERQDGAFGRATAAPAA